MKVLVLHNLYQQPGGEDVAVRSEVELLAKAGHDVRLELVANHDIIGVGKKVQTFLSAPHSREAFILVNKWLREFPAEVVHVHNFFPLLTLSVHEAAAASGSAVVQTLHNFRTLCASATFSRNGAICEKCLHGARGWALVHRCYRNSLAGSMALVRMQQHGAKTTWINHIDRFIALTEFTKSKFVEGGLPADKISVKPNFLSEAPPRSDWSARAGALFVGRLSPEKGVSVLIENWHKVGDVPLTIVGDGPERPALERAAPPGVRFIGHLDRTAVLERMRMAKVLMVPSTCYEGFPMTVVEAFACGLPVICSHLGSLAEIVEPYRHGMHFMTGNGDHMAAIVREAFADDARLAGMSECAAHTHAERYGPTANLAALQRIYDVAIRSASIRMASVA